MTIASLAMYPFIQLRTSYDRLWDAVRSDLSFAAPALDWDLEPIVACRRRDLLVGQTCGWPLVNDLGATVKVVGTFDCDVDGAVDGTYSSVLVSRTDEPLTHILHRDGLVVAANSSDSLSGWISLQSVAVADGVHIDSVEWTGSHAASVDAVSQGRADLASIDAVSWAHLGSSDLSVVGHGPRVPCLPLVTSQSSAPSVVGELRQAFAAAVGDPTMADVCASLRIRRFLDRELADYERLSDLVELW
jgi:ABC-type phosphate/phosphonate transport system substrate-binding protein